MADETSPAAVAAPPPTADPAVPLPESNWLWRRVFVFVSALILFGFKWWYAGALGNIALSTNPNTPRQAIMDSVHGLVGTIQRDQYLFGLLALLYLAAATTEQLTHLVQSAGVLKGGFLSRATATAPDGSTAAAGMASGPAIPSAPPVPPRPSAPPAPPAVEVDAAPTSMPK